MHLQFLGRVSLFLFFFSLPALMPPLDPGGCSTASPNPSIPNSARDTLAESILTAAKNSAQTTQAAMFVGPNQSLGDRRKAPDLTPISIADSHKATCRL